MLHLRALLLLLTATAAGLVLAGTASATFPGAAGRVAFQSDREGDWEIYTMNPDGSDQRPLLDRPGTDEFNPAWSPNGHALAIQTGPAGQSGNFDIATVNEHGSGFRVVVGGPTNDRWPRYCPGDWIVFQRTATDGSSRIWKVRADGTDLAQLTNGPGSDFEPTCHPGGGKVGFSSTREGGPFGYEIALDGTGLDKITSVGALDLDYSPDGRLIAFAGQDPSDGSNEIFTQNLATGQVTQRTSSAPGHEARIPTFTPEFGTSVGFSTRLPLGAVALPIPLYFTERNEDETINLVPGVRTGDNPCDERLQSTSRLLQGPGDTGGPGKNSGQNVQPKTACKKKDRTLEIQTTLGADRITITDGPGGTAVVKDGGNEIFSGARSDFDTLTVRATTGDVISNLGSLKLVIVNADPTGTDTSAWVANKRLKVEGGHLVNTIAVKKVQVDGKTFVDVLTNAGPGLVASERIARFDPADFNEIVVNPGNATEVILDDSLKRVTVNPRRNTKAATVTRVASEVSVAPVKPKDNVLYRVEFGPGGLELIPLKKVGNQLVRVYTIRIINPSIGSVDMTGGSSFDTTYAGTDESREGQSARSGGVRPIAVLMDTKGGNDVIECEGPDFRCTVKAGAGNDRIDVRNGLRDVVDGGAGRDTVLADASDVIRNAETVTRG